MAKTLAVLEEDVRYFQESAERFSATLERYVKAVPGDYRSSENPAGTIATMKELEAWDRSRLAHARLALARAKGLSAETCKRFERLAELCDSRSRAINYLHIHDSTVLRGDTELLKYNDFDPEKIRSNLDQNEDEIARLEDELRGNP